MRKPKIILGWVLLVVLILGARFYFGFRDPSSQYFKFIKKDAVYFSQVAHACDSILEQHAIGSSGLRRLPSIPFSWSLPPDDPSLPRVIRALQPDMIILATNRVYIGFGVGRLNWGIIWEKGDMDETSWTLETNADGLRKTHYAETRQ